MFETYLFKRIDARHLVGRQGIEEPARTIGPEAIWVVLGFGGAHAYTVLLQVESWAVNWSVSSDATVTAVEMSVDDLFARSPDLREDYSIRSGTLQYVSVTDLSPPLPVRVG